MRQELLDKLHNTLLEIMDEIDRVCKENGITYYLAGGTLLGAVRHKGFIPWDDDMDIMMPRKDYERFCSIFSSVASEKYYLQTSSVNPQYWKAHAKICKANTVFQENTGIIEGIFVDVFPIDVANENNGILQQMRFDTVKACDRIICWRLFKGYNPGKAYLLCYLTKWFPVSWIRRFQQYLMAIQNKKYNCYVLFEGVGIYGARRSLWPIVKFGVPTESLFEGREYLIPSGYNDVLSITFHDYMQLPPVDQRRTHNPKRLSFDVNGPDEILD